MSPVVVGYNRAGGGDQVKVRPSKSRERVVEATAESP